MSFLRTSSPRRSSALVVAGLFTLIPLASACGGPNSSQALGPSAANAADQDFSNAVLIDVRTPEEFAQQHLEGALNINLQSPDFVSQIDALDRDAAYAVYCRSGNRSAQAVAIMKDLGFTAVSDHGSVSQASQSLGIAVVS
jgi:rhodanese-related sulfurtransferase